MGFTNFHQRRACWAGGDLDPSSLLSCPLPPPPSYFFVFLRRISTGQEESHLPPPRVPRPLHEAGRKGGLNPLANPHPRARGMMTCLGSLGSAQGPKFGVSAICVQTPSPASWGTHRHMGWDKTPDRNWPMPTRWQRMHCLMSAAALGYCRLLSIANLKWLIFTACSYKFLKMSGPKLGQVSSRGFFGSFALPSRIYLPLPAKQQGPCTRGKQELLSRASLLFRQSAPPASCASLPSSVTEKWPWLHLPLSPPQRPARAAKLGTTPSVPRSLITSQPRCAHSALFRCRQPSSLTFRGTRPAVHLFLPMLLQLLVIKRNDSAVCAVGYIYL